MACLTPSDSSTSKNIDKRSGRRRRTRTTMRRPAWWYQPRWCVNPWRSSRNLCRLDMTIIWRCVAKTTILGRAWKRHVWSQSVPSSPSKGKHHPPRRTKNNRWKMHLLAQRTPPTTNIVKRGWKWIRRRLPADKGFLQNVCRAWIRHYKSSARRRIVFDISWISNSGRRAHVPTWIHWNLGNQVKQNNKTGLE